ncbi:Hypothetical predicted protein [Olea europaea subsp. europaea]|uniref:Uncharacterized protein n=1 Tax=Olea europaea subsp. europaea TaxID=158383 RepID=A0A8S0TWJ5_OLEEU|nr:Hypothetical predicted protein [Olea europaea subsp. europaea]
MTFQEMGKYKRTYKSRLRKQIRIQTSSSVNRTRTIFLLRPKNVAWKKFVEDTLSTNFQEKSAKFSKMRANQKLLHTVGRKGYQCTTYDLKKNYPDMKGLRTRV